MPANHDDRSSRFRICTPGEVPFAVLREEAPGEGDDISEDDLEGLTHGYLADEPWHLSMKPKRAHEVYVARGLYVGAGAKEGHGITRQGVDLVGLAPTERQAVTEGTRRAVVAVLDTVVSPHEWIGDGTGKDPFWRDARHLTAPWDPRDADGCSLPVPTELGDSTSTHSGHGTFITGVVRLIAPDATVISLPVMDNTGVVHPALLESALQWLLDRAHRAVQEDRPDLAVDVVNLSFGRYLTDGRRVTQHDAVGELVHDLGLLGVRVIASAGNRGSTQEVVPAAWSGEDTDEHTALRSVGALDPDGGAAPYSNLGSWVSVGARGTALVSCLPQFEAVQWPPPLAEIDTQTGALALAAHEDPNLQRSTFARWSGTSFAAALVSATQAARLMTPRILGGLPGVPGGVGEHADRALEARKRAALVWGTFDPMPSTAPAAGA